MLIISQLGTSLLCLFLPIMLGYAPVLKFLTYYAQYYAHVKDLCLKFDCFYYSIFKVLHITRTVVQIS